jgi:glucose/arabinose dehydrogenase
MTGSRRPIRGSRRVLLIALAALAGCGGGDDGETRAAEGRNGGVEVVAEGLEVPWEIAFLPAGDALVTERPGRIRLLERGGRLREEPVAEVDVSEQGEGGLLGLALDPGFSDNGVVKYR